MCFMSFATHFSAVCSTRYVDRFHPFQHTPPLLPHQIPCPPSLSFTALSKALHLTITDPVSKSVRLLQTDGERWRGGGYKHPLLSTLQLFIRERERERQLRLCDSKWLLLYIPLWSARRQRREYYDDITGDSIDSRDKAISVKLYSLSLSLQRQVDQKPSVSTKSVSALDQSFHISCDRNRALGLASSSMNTT